MPGKIKCRWEREVLESNAGSVENKRLDMKWKEQAVQNTQYSKEYTKRKEEEEEYYDSIGFDNQLKSCLEN